VRAVPRVLVALVALVTVAAVVPASAQSGRRIPTRRPDPPPAAPEPAPRPAPGPVEPARPKTPLTVGKSITNFGIREDVCAFVVETCLRRLTGSGSVQVTNSADLSRKQAIDAAKKDASTFVLWFQFSADQADEDPARISRSSREVLVVQYVLYEPGTAKVRTQGRLYFVSDTSFGGRGTVPYMNRGSTGYTPEEAGAKVAEAVLEALGGTGQPRF